MAIWAAHMSHVGPGRWRHGHAAEGGRWQQRGWHPQGRAQHRAWRRALWRSALLKGATGAVLKGLRHAHGGASPGPWAAAAPGLLLRRAAHLAVAAARGAALDAERGPLAGLAHAREHLQGASAARSGGGAAVALGGPQGPVAASAAPSAQPQPRAGSQHVPSATPHPGHARPRTHPPPLLHAPLPLCPWGRPRHARRRTFLLR